MARSERECLRELAPKNIYSKCGKQIPERARHPYGSGGFLQLDCVAVFNPAELVERAKKIHALAERHRNA
jgi:hypothetical protein